MAAGNFRKESLAKNVKGLFKAVASATSSISATTTRSSETKPTGYAGRVIFPPVISTASVRLIDSATTTVGAQIVGYTISNGEVSAVDVRNNAATAQTVTLVWTFVGNF